MTNRERARAWLLDTYPSAWESEHVDALTGLLDEVSRAGREDERARLRHVILADEERRKLTGDAMYAESAVEHEFNRANALERACADKDRRIVALEGRLRAALSPRLLAFSSAGVP